MKPNKNEKDDPAVAGGGKDVRDGGGEPAAITFFVALQTDKLTGSTTWRLNWKDVVLEDEHARLPEPEAEEAILRAKTKIISALMDGPLTIALLNARTRVKRKRLRAALRLLESEGKIKVLAGRVRTFTLNNQEDVRP